MQEEQSLKKYTVLIASVISFMTAFMGSAINVALPVIEKELTVDTMLLSWLATSYLLTSAVLLIPVGKLSDIYGRKKFLQIGIIIFSLGSALCGFAISGEALLVSRLIQGVGASMIFTTVTSILVSVFPAGERGKVIGVNITSVYSGLSLGPFLGGVISQNIGWRYIFYITFFTGLLVIILIRFRLKKEWTEAKDESFDLKGSVIFILSLISLMLGFTFLPSLSGFVLITSGIIIFFIFLKIEDKTAFPVLNIQLFKSNRTFTFSNIAALINYSATFAISFLMSLYLQNVKGLEPQTAGLILVTQPVMMAVFSSFAGKLSDKTEPQIVSSIGMGIITVCLIMFTFISADYAITLIILNLSLLGFGFALFSSPNMNAIMGSVEKRYYGVASSTLASMRMIGQMFSMGFVIVIFSLFLTNGNVTPDNYQTFIHSLRIAFILFSVLCFIGIFASLSRGKIHRDT